MFGLVCTLVVSMAFGFHIKATRSTRMSLYMQQAPVPQTPQEPPSQPPRRERVDPIPLPSVGMGKDQMDVVSRLMKDRILMLGSEVNDEVANNMMSQMLYLASADPEADITLYINSPGGSVQAGLAIFDTMQYIPCDVNTVCFGMAASMGAFLLSAGTPGKRRSLPNSRIMIHQPLGGSQGEATDLEITAKLMLHTKEVLNTYMANFCDQPIDKLRKDTDRDFYMTPKEALAYGLIDEVIKTKGPQPDAKIPSLRVPPPLSIYDLGNVATKPSKGGSGGAGELKKTWS
jgi:ATP-dependent Clp protease, protease subunit